jgi:hypothetical protein
MRDARCAMRAGSAHVQWSFCPVLFAPLPHGHTCEDGHGPTVERGEQGLDHPGIEE